MLRKETGIETSDNTVRTAWIHDNTNESKSITRLNSMMMKMFHTHILIDATRWEWYI